MSFSDYASIIIYIADATKSLDEWQAFGRSPDVEVCCGDRRWSLHKSILRERSSYFAKCIDAAVPDTSNKVTIHLDRVNDLTILDWVIRYMYSEGMCTWAMCPIHLSLEHQLTHAQSFHYTTSFPPRLSTSGPRWIHSFASLHMSKCGDMPTNSSWTNYRPSSRIVSKKSSPKPSGFSALTIGGSRAYAEIGG